MKYRQPNMSIIKKLFFILSFLIAMLACSFGQNENDSGFKLAFDEYKVDSCLYDILAAVVETDSAQVRFPSDVYFYNISYGNYTHYRDVIIRPSRWHKDLPLDTKGIIVVEGAKFVLMGRIENDSLFKKTDNKIELSITYPVPQVFDSLDKKSWLGWDRSPTALVGSIKFCGAPPIDLHIDVDKRLERLNFAEKHP